MIWHEVDYHLHACVVCAVDKCLEFLDAAVYVDGYIGVDIIVVLDGIRRTGAPFHYMWIVAVYAVAGVIGLVGVLYHSGVPYMCYSKPFYAFENF